jgi:hypothetical protein
MPARGGHHNNKKGGSSKPPVSKIKTKIVSALNRSNFNEQKKRGMYSKQAGIASMFGKKPETPASSNSNNDN